MENNIDLMAYNKFWHTTNFSLYFFQKLHCSLVSSYHTCAGSSYLIFYLSPKFLNICFAAFCSHLQVCFYSLLIPSPAPVKSTL